MLNLVHIRLYCYTGGGVWSILGFTAIPVEVCGLLVACERGHLLSLTSNVTVSVAYLQALPSDMYVLVCNSLVANL